jgi:hypothetical protein
MYTNKLCVFLFTILLLGSCTRKVPTGLYKASVLPTAPDYSKEENWAALPTKSDMADKVPAGEKDEQDNAQVDVFFVHPTSYTGKASEFAWNADVADAKINKKTDDGAIQFQASIFNGVGKVYAPRYRQAHLYSYFSKDSTSALAAFRLAYSDVKSAFEYYLEHYNHGRPIIIASHSQGTTHSIRLMKEFFDGGKLKNKLVVAYLVGMPVTKDYYTNIPICQDSTQTGCFCSWRTYEKGFFPPYHTPGTGIRLAVTNPLTWKTDTTYAPKTLNQGGTLRKLDVVVPNLVDAQIHDGFIWVNKPTFTGSFLIRTHNYHVGDFNLYYLNVRNDAKRRVGLFWK